MAEQAKEHLSFLDYVRGLAILAVFLFHSLGAAYGQYELQWNGWFRDFNGASFNAGLTPITIGWAGVAVFFVVSGFCIHLSHCRNAGAHWSAFFQRRFFRIYPPYLLALLIFGLIVPLSRVSLTTLAGWAQIASHVLLVHNFHIASLWGINASFWSIALEVQLYLIYPILLVLVNRLGWRGTLILIGALEVLMRGASGVFLTITDRYLPLWVTESPFFFWYSWSIGAALADAYLKGDRLPFTSQRWPIWLFLAVSTYSVKPLFPFSFLFFSLFTASVVSGLLVSKNMKRADSIGIKHLRDLGIWSYSFYLLHEPLINLVPSILHRMGIAEANLFTVFLVILCTYPLILFISSFFFRHVEMRSMAIGRLFSKANLVRPQRVPLCKVGSE